MRLVEYEGVTSKFHECGTCLLGDLACDFFCFLFRKSGFEDLAFDHLIFLQLQRDFFHQFRCGSALADPDCGLRVAQLSHYKSSFPSS